MPRRLAKLARRVADRLEDAVYPPATSAQDQWQRVVMNRVVDRHLAMLEPEKHSAAEISGEAHRDRPWKSFRSLNFPEFDLCAPLVDDQRYDVVICEQVLEHVIDPYAAARNLRELCVPGGWVIVSTPFLIKVHELPMYGMRDYWRFTPRGLQVLLENAGLEVDEVSSWGNRDCVVGNLSRWSAYRPWHSLRNETDLPVQVWAFARNPG